MALMVTESCRHTNQLGTSKKTKTYIITSKNKNLHYAAPECVTTQPDVDSIALRVLLRKNALSHCTAGHKLAAVASPRYHTDCRDVAEVPPYYYYYYDYYDPT